MQGVYMKISELMLRTWEFQISYHKIYKIKQKDPLILQNIGKKCLEKNDVGSYKKLLPRYKSSIFQDFESFLRTEADLVDDNINLILDENNSKFINYETPPGIYSIEDLSEVLSKIFESIVMITVIRN